MTPRQIDILHHTLGVRPDCREPFRNYYVAGPGHHAMADLEALEAKGMMRRARTPAFCDQSDVVFVCTDEGRSYALENLPPEPKRTKYDQYCRDDCDSTFAEWLGIVKPKVEVRGRWKHYEYRMYRPAGYVRTEISGVWAPTIKAAKSSYKAALKASKEAA